MKSFLVPLTLILSMTVTSCGKKAKEKDSKHDEKIDPSVEEVYFNAFKDLKAALEARDEDTFIKIVTENPGIELNQILATTGETFFTTSIKKKLNKVRVFLMEKNVSLEKANVLKETPLIAAVKSKNVVAVSVLLDRKVDLEKRNLEEETALLVALKNGDSEIANMLIDKAANIYASDKNGNNAQVLAEKYHADEALEKINTILDLKFRAPEVDTFKRLLEDGDQQSIKYILSRYPRVATDKEYQEINPLAILVDSKNDINALATAEVLIKYETNVNGPGQMKITPLIKSAMASKKGFAELFLNNKADPHSKDVNGKTALIHAIEQNNEDIVNMLLANHADIEYKYKKSDGKMMKVDACDTVFAMESKYSSGNAKAVYKRIKKSLGCNIIDRFF